MTILENGLNYTSAMELWNQERSSLVKGVHCDNFSNNYK